jgi:hypothetical protein
LIHRGLEHLQDITEEQLVFVLKAILSLPPATLQKYAAANDLEPSHLLYVDENYSPLWLIADCSCLCVRVAA